MNSFENQAPLVDLNYLNRQVKGKKEQLLEILKLFITHVPPAIIEIKQLVEKKAWPELRGKIHNIKSYYGYLGNNSLQQKLVDWEQALQNNPGDYNHSEAMDDLDRKTILIVERLKQILLEGV